MDSHTHGNFKLYTYAPTEMSSVICIPVFLGKAMGIALKGIKIPQGLQQFRMVPLATHQY